MPYHHPTLPSRIDEKSKDSGNGDFTAMSPDDLELMKKIAAERGFKSPIEYNKSLSWSNNTTWCGDLQTKLNECKKSPPSAQCDRIRQNFTSDCGATKIDDRIYAEKKLENKAKLRGMSTAEFVDYARHEKEKCKGMCDNCKKFPAALDCDKEKVNKFCGST